MANAWRIAVTCQRAKVRYPNKVDNDIVVPLIGKTKDGTLSLF